MSLDDLEPFRGLPLTRGQDAEIRAYIAHKLARDIGHTGIQFHVE